MQSAIGRPKALQRRQAAFRLGHGRWQLVPNANEQAALKRMKAMRRAKKTYRAIGAAVGKDARDGAAHSCAPGEDLTLPDSW